MTTTTTIPTTTDPTAERDDEPQKMRIELEVRPGTKLGGNVAGYLNVGQGVLYADRCAKEADVRTMVRWVLAELAMTAEAILDTVTVQTLCSDLAWTFDKAGLTGPMFVTDLLKVVQEFGSEADGQIPTGVMLYDFETGDAIRRPTAAELAASTAAADCQFGGGVIVVDGVKAYAV